MDHVSALADESKKFASFLTVARKFSYACIYIFHIIYPEKSIWRTILSQSNLFNIFLVSVSLAHVGTILGSVCIRKTKNIFHNWRSRLAVSLLNWPIETTVSVCPLTVPALIKMDQEDLELKQTNRILKLFILMLLMMKGTIMSLLVNA